jgi:protein involved in polysaccharide export with SLBB domain
MQTISRCLCLATVALVCASAMGCGENLDRLNAFLLEPRSPVSGIEYRVLPPDVLLINSIHVPDINNFRAQVRPDGKINLPLLGEVAVAGNTPAEIESVLKAKSREFYEEVDATVQVAEFRSQKIYVFGQVSRPGPLPWTGTDTLIDVLAQVQPTPMAWPERIKVVRGKGPLRGGYPRPDTEKNGAAPAKADPEKGATPPAEFGTAKTKADGGKEKPQTAEEAMKAAEAAARKAEAGDGADAEVITINMMNMVASGDLSVNVLLRPGDVVYVPPNPLAAVGLALQQVLFPILPAMEAVSAPVSAMNQFGGNSGR